MLNDGFVLAESLVSVFIVSLICMLLMMTMTMLETSTSIGIDKYLSNDIRSYTKSDLAFSNNINVEDNKLTIEKPRNNIMYYYDNQVLWRKINNTGSERLLSNLVDLKFKIEDKLIVMEYKVVGSNDDYKLVLGSYE